MPRSYGGLLKQNTTVVVNMGPFVDKTDDVTPESGLAATMDDASSGILIAKNGGSLTLRAVTGAASTVYDTFGYYKVTLASGDVNTLGKLTVDYSLPATTKPVCQEYDVVPAVVFDSLVNGSDNFDVSLVQINGATGPVTSLVDLTVSGYNSTSHKINGVILADTTTNLTNAASSGDLTSVMKTSITTACTNSTPVAASVATGVVVSGDLSSTMKTSVESGIRRQLDSIAIVASPVTGSVGYLIKSYIDAAISTRLDPSGTLATVTNLTNAPTVGDLTATMKASVVSGVNYASGMIVASVAGAVGSVTSKTGFKLASDGLDVVAAPADLANDTAARATFVGMFRALYNRFYNKVSQSSTTQTVSNDTSTGVISMAVSVSGGVETKGKSS
jgi:hypothetical protein